MPRISFEQRLLDAQDGETVLQCLERHGVEVSTACRSGVCQSCMLKAPPGKVPAAAQAGLKPVLRAQGYFLACVCPALDGLDGVEVQRSADLPAVRARVDEVEPLSATVMRVWLRPEGELGHEAGQFIQLVRPHDGLVRPYSIASLPCEQRLELHVAVRPAGRMSHWLARAEGETVELRGPAGDCFYLPDDREQPIALAGTGTGLAPLLGVVRTALRAGHRGPIRLYHGSSHSSGLYLFDALEELARAHANFHVLGSVLAEDDARPRVRRERIESLLLADHPSLAGHRVFLCGNASLVRVLRKKVYLAGAALADIHSDPFEFAA